MHGHTRDDLWMEYKRRKDAWRARRAAQREAWRQAWRRHSSGCGTAGWGGMHSETPAAAASDAQAARIADLENTVKALSERIKVLERIVVTDETKLAAEIERLRRDEGRRNES